LKYGQLLAIDADDLDTSPMSSDTARYVADRAKDLNLAKTNGLDVVYQQYDAVLFPANRGAGIAAKAGYPSITVPGGFYVNPPVGVATPPVGCPASGSSSCPFPAGFNAQPAPYGVTFSGPAFSEGKLIGYAYAFEQATHHRVAPPSVPALPTDTVAPGQN
jgi:amidase